MSSTSTPELKTYQVLVASENEALRELLKDLVQGTVRAEILECSTEKQAREFIEVKQDLGCIICDQFKEATGIFKAFLARSTQLRFVLISNHDPNALSHGLRQRISAFVRKDYLGEDLIPALWTIFNQLMSADPTQAAAIGNGYFPVSLATLRNFNIVPCDLFVRLSEDRHIKVLNHGDLFSEADIAHHLNKNFETFWARREDMQVFVSTLTKDIVSIENVKNLAPGQAIQSAEKLHGSARDLIRSLGVTPETQTMIKSSVDLAMTTVQRSPGLAELLKALNTNPDAYLSSHSVLLSYISCWMGSLMNWNSESTQYKLAMASLLHDVTLAESRVAQFDTVQEMLDAPEGYTAQEVRAFEEHPIKAAEIIQKMSELPADIDQIVLQHHEKPDGTGFPHKLNSKQISPLSALFIMSHDLTRYILTKGKEANLSDFLSKHEGAYASGHFKRMAHILRNSSSQWSQIVQ